MGVTSILIFRASITESTSSFPDAINSLRTLSFNFPASNVLFSLPTKTEQKRINCKNRAKLERFELYTKFEKPRLIKKEG